MYKRQGTGDEKMRIEKVGADPTTGRDIALEIRAVGEYSPKSTDRNMINGEFAQINLKTDSCATFEFAFFVGNNGVRRPMMIEEFYFSMFDLDMNWDGGGKESLGIDTFDTALLTATTELIPEYRDGEFTAVSYTHLRAPRD